MALRIFLGLIKGLVVGGALGYGFSLLPPAFHGAGMKYVLYGLIGALTGFIAGKAVWRQETVWTSVVKMVFGLGVGVGLYALASKVLGDPQLAISALGPMGSQRPLTDFFFIFGPIVGVIYGIFVELDDGGKPEQKAKAEEAKQAPQAPQA